MGPWAGRFLVLFPAGKSTNKFISRLKVIFVAPWGTEPVLPFLYPLARFLEPHRFCTVAPLRNDTEPVLPFLSPSARFLELHCSRYAAPQHNLPSLVLFLLSEKGLYNCCGRVYFSA